MVSSIPRQVFLAVCCGIATAAALWLFGTVQRNREDLVRVQTIQEQQGSTLGEIKSDVKALVLRSLPTAGPSK